MHKNDAQEYARFIPRMIGLGLNASKDMVGESRHARLRRLFLAVKVNSSFDLRKKGLWGFHFGKDLILET